MFYKIEDFAREWKQEYELTLKLMDALTDRSLEQAVGDERRTLGQIAWHLVDSLRYMSHFGLAFEGAEGDKTAPGSAAVIASQYRAIGQSLLDAVASQWTDADLLSQHEIMGELWDNGASLRFTLMHQAHHRGQMTVLMRQAGLPVPGLYGPSYDEWIEKGLAPLP